jgi:hypothetical protein
MIAIVDYGMGNLRSVEKAFLKVGADVKVTSNPKVIDDADGEQYHQHHLIQRLLMMLMVLFSRVWVHSGIV